MKSGKWQRMHRGIYATYTGTPTREAKLWAAVLWAGKGAMISHQTAAELQEFTEKTDRDIHVTVPSNRHPLGKPMPGVVVHRSSQSQRVGDVANRLPHTYVADTVLDLVATARTMDDAYAWVSRAVARGKANVAELRNALERRSRFPGRSWLSDALAEAQDGSNSGLELRYTRDVERAHGLPEAKRQARRAIDGTTHYKDNLYELYRICVELDGVAYHRDRQHQDRHRDNVNLAVDDVRTFRFDIVGVTQGACESAAMVAAALRRNGWQGIPHPCGKPGCRMRTSLPRRETPLMGGVSRQDLFRNGAGAVELTYLSHISDMRRGPAGGGGSR
jgi:very-short-patch-repair endonuclease